MADGKGQRRDGARQVREVAQQLGKVARFEYPRWFLATEDGDIGFDCWLKEIKDSGYFMLGPGFTNDEREELKQLLHTARTTH